MSDLRFEEGASDFGARPVSNSRGGFRLNKARGKVMGVSAGIADYTGVDVTLVRVAWVLGTLLGFGSLILVYIAIGLIAD